MKITGFFLALLLGSLVYADSPDWRHSLQNLQDKPTFVMIETDYCPWCKKMKETTLQEPEVLAKLQHFNSVKMQKRDWNKQGIKHVRLVPTLIFLDANSNVLTSKQGYKNSREFLTLLKQILQRSGS